MSDTPCPKSEALRLINTAERDARCDAAQLGIVGGLVSLLIGGVIALTPWGQSAVGLKAAWWFFVPGFLVPPVLGASGFFIPVVSTKRINLARLRTALHITFIAIPLAAFSSAFVWTGIWHGALVMLLVGSVMAVSSLVPAIMWSFPPQAALGIALPSWLLSTLLWIKAGWGYPGWVGSPYTWGRQPLFTHLLLPGFALLAMMGIQIAMGARLPSKRPLFPEKIRLAFWVMGSSLLVVGLGVNWSLLPWAGGLLLATWLFHLYPLVRFFFPLTRGEASSKRNSAEGFLLGWSTLGIGLVLGLLMGLKPGLMPSLRTVHLHLNLMAGVLPILLGAAAHLLNGALGLESRQRTLGIALRFAWIGGVLFSFRSLFPLASPLGGTLHLAAVAWTITLLQAKPTT
ncbi:hypothetical protein H8D30_03515 [bacterium]|nr:hypothetical protein [bacterium]